MERSMQSWLFCDKCHKVILFKNSRNHRASCPEETREYIGSGGEVNVSVVKISDNYLSTPCIILHPLLTEFMQWKTGDVVSLDSEFGFAVNISKNGSDPLVAGLAVTDYQLYQSNSKNFHLYSCLHKVRLIVASRVTICYISEKNVKKTSSVGYKKHFLQQVKLHLVVKRFFTDHRIVRVGNKFGGFSTNIKPFKIISILSDENEDITFDTIDNNDSSNFDDVNVIQKPHVDGFTGISCITDLPNSFNYARSYPQGFYLFDKEATELFFDNPEYNNKEKYSRNQPSSSLKFTHGNFIGGLQEEVASFKILTRSFLEYNNLFIDSGYPNIGGIIISGPPGCGKTLLVTSVINELGYNLKTLDPLKYLDSDFSISNVYEGCLKNAAFSVIFLDDLHLSSLKKSSVLANNERQFLCSLTSILDKNHETNSKRRVLFVGATNRLDDVDASLRRPGRLDKHIELHVPTCKKRLEILQILLQLSRHSLSLSHFTEISELAHGFVGADLLALVKNAALQAVERYVNSHGQKVLDKTDKSLLSHEGESKNVDTEELTNELRKCNVNDIEKMTEGPLITYKDLLDALKIVQPSAMLEVSLDVPAIHWSDIGGQEKLIQQICQSIEWPIKYPEAFDRLGIDPPKGLLMYGPPGCSKTMIAKALATESRLNFISIKGPEIFNKWVGESERAIRQIFRRARLAAPAIIFIDEIDAIAVSRAGGIVGKSNTGSSVSERVVAQLLTELDGIEKLKDVTVIAATNRPDMIDQALLRPGRIDRLVYVPLPDEKAREEIFKIIFQRTPISKDVSINDLVKRTEGYSGAEIKALCQEAGLLALQENGLMNVESVSFKHLEKALNIVKPRTDSKMFQLYENFGKGTTILGLH